MVRGSRGDLASSENAGERRPCRDLAGTMCLGSETVLEPGETKCYGGMPSVREVMPSVREGRPDRCGKLNVEMYSVAFLLRLSVPLLFNTTDIKSSDLFSCLFN